MLAKSPSNRPLLIAATSGRALAAAARRAGYRPLVADFFCDDDTRALADGVTKLPGSLASGIAAEGLVDCLEALAGDEEQPLAFIYGSGFEDRPELIEEISRYFPLAGNGADAIRRVKDPSKFSADCAVLGIPHPPFQWDEPTDPQNWMAKRVGGAGGSHVRPAAGARKAPNTYYQRFLAGQSISVLFMSDGRAALIVGFSRQWAAPTPATPHRYGGAVRLKRFDRKKSAQIGEWLSGLTARAGLKGLCSADFIRTRDGYHLVEINPRPGATLDIFDNDDAPLLEAHLRAAAGEIGQLPQFADCMASMILYANEPIGHFPAISWPDWVADRQSPGTSLSSGEPICTAFSRGPNAAATQKAVGDFARQLRRNWEQTK